MVRILRLVYASNFYGVYGVPVFTPSLIIIIIMILCNYSRFRVHLCSVSKQHEGSTNRNVLPDLWHFQCHWIHHILCLPLPSEQKYFCCWLVPILCHTSLNRLDRTCGVWDCGLVLQEQAATSNRRSRGPTYTDVC